MPRFKAWLPALALAALFLLAVAMCARAAEDTEQCFTAQQIEATLAGQHPPFVAYDELTGAELAAFLAVTGGEGLPAAQIVAFLQLHTDGVVIALFDAAGCMVAWAEDARYGYDQKAKLARERAGS